jgi:hypothetical protein
MVTGACAPVTGLETKPGAKEDCQCSSVFTGANGHHGHRSSTASCSSGLESPTGARAGTARAPSAYSAWSVVKGLDPWGVQTPELTAEYTEYADPSQMVTGACAPVTGLEAKPRAKEDCQCSSVFTGANGHHGHRSSTASCSSGLESPTGVRAGTARTPSVYSAWSVVKVLGFRVHAVPNFRADALERAQR